MPRAPSPGLIGFLVAVIPLYAMLIAAHGLLVGNVHVEHTVTFSDNTQSEIKFDRCIPYGRLRQRMDGDDMMWRDKREHFSQCWNDS